MTASTGRPEVCAYCDGKGRMPETGQGRDGFYECGFCEGGVPLDTQEDWDRTWGRTWEQVDGNGSSEVPR